MSPNLSDRTQENLKKLADIIAKTPSAKVIYLIRHNKDGKTVDVPLADGHAERTIKNQPTWEVTGSDKQMDDAVEALFMEPAADSQPPEMLPPIIEPPVEVPPKPSEEATQLNPPTVPVEPPPAPAMGYDTDPKPKAPKKTAKKATKKK